MPADADNSRARATHSTTKGDADALGLAVGVALGLTDPLGVGDALGLATGEALSDAVALLDGSGDGDVGGSTGALGSRVPVRVDNETVRSELVSALASTGGVKLSDAVSDAEADAVGDADGLDDGIGDALSDGLGDKLGDGLGDGLGDADCDGSSSLGAHNFGISAGICHVSITSESVTSEVGVTGLASEDSAAWAGTRGAKSRSVAVEAAITRTARERRTDARMRFRIGCIEAISHDDAQSKPS